MKVCNSEAMKKVKALEEELNSITQGKGAVKQILTSLGF